VPDPPKRLVLPGDDWRLPEPTLPPDTQPEPDPAIVAANRARIEALKHQPYHEPPRARERRVAAPPVAAGLGQAQKPKRRFGRRRYDALGREINPRGKRYDAFGRPLR
jgi:hypothetical protein